ncbi:adenylyl-sulfate kinase [Burkholderia diffusa]|uniref:adenylyl-sulfate kinase n=1 Tax=Burkholderia diffusa TaxID=488732 RepID=UPI0009C0B2DC
MRGERSEGLYYRAAIGDIPRSTGLTDPYEAPVDPSLRLNTTRQQLTSRCARSSINTSGRESLGPHDPHGTGAD